MVDSMIPILAVDHPKYNGGMPNTPNAMKQLSDSISCTIHEDLNYVSNGEYYLELEYPTKTNWSKDFYVGRTYVLAKHPDFDDYQWFIVTSVTKNIRTITVHADHYSYLLRGYLSNYIQSGTLQEYFQYAQRQTDIYGTTENPYIYQFYFSIDGTAPSGTYAQQIPISIFDTLGGVENSVLQTFNGEYVFDNRKVIWKRKRGSNKQFRITTSSNLTNLNFVEDVGNRTSRVEGYVVKQDGTVVIGDAQYNEYLDTIYAFDFSPTIAVDLSSEFKNVETVTKAQIESMTLNYIKRNKDSLCKTDVSVDIEFEILKKRYLNRGENMTTVNLGDTVTLIANDQGINATAKVVSIEYDVLREEYSNIGLGNKKITMYDAIQASIQKNKLNINKGE